MMWLYPRYTRHGGNNAAVEALLQDLLAELHEQGVPDTPEVYAHARRKVAEWHRQMQADWHYQTSSTRPSRQQEEQQRLLRVIIGEEGLDPDRVRRQMHHHVVTQCRLPEHCTQLLCWGS
jgi:hypothetical protein